MADTTLTVEDEEKIDVSVENAEIISDRDAAILENKNNIATNTANISKILTNSAGSHNSFYRGKDITDLFYDGTLSEQIAAGTFDEAFPGDYIIGSSSGNVYLIADLDYNYLCGDVACEKHHILVVPLASMGSEQMNSSNTTSGAYVGSEFYTSTLDTYRAIIQADFGTDHILTVRRYLQNSINSYGMCDAGAWYDSDIDLMNENMVFGSKIRSQHTSATSSSIILPNVATIDKSQLAIFAHRKDLIIAKGKGTTNIESKSRTQYWLRDVVSDSYFAHVSSSGYALGNTASSSSGVRPAFLIY